MRGEREVAQRFLKSNRWQMDAPSGTTGKLFLSRNHSMKFQRQDAKTPRRKAKTSFRASGFRLLVCDWNLYRSTFFAPLRLRAFALKMPRPAEGPQP
jgi:hypothetical protein